MNAPTNSAPVSPAPVAPKISISSDVSDLVRGSLAPKNSVGTASVDFYRAVLASVGIEDPDSLSFAETVEVTRRLYAPSADFRRDRAEVAKSEREIEAKKLAEKRAAEKTARLEKEKKAILAKLAALEAK